MKLSEVARSKLSPMMMHYVELKEKYPDVILFYRLGDFYEMFFEDAETVSHELELTLTGRNAGLEERVPMCGVPHHAVDVYIDKLVKKGFKVAICEQLEDAKNTKGIVKRDVTEVISSGTIINSNSLDEKVNNYIGSIYDYEYCYCIVYTDITTGELYSEIIIHDTNKLINEILSFGLSEVIVNSVINPNIIKLLKNQYQLTVTVTDEILDNDNYHSCYRSVVDLRYVTAIKHLLHYLVVEQKRTLSHLQKVIINEDDNFLKMDVHTKRNLELTESLRLKDRNYIDDRYKITENDSEIELEITKERLKKFHNKTLKEKYSKEKHLKKGTSRFPLKLFLDFGCFFSSLGFFCFFCRLLVCRCFGAGHGVNNLTYCPTVNLHLCSVLVDFKSKNVVLYGTNSSYNSSDSAYLITNHNAVTHFIGFSFLLFLGSYHKEIHNKKNRNHNNEHRAHASCGICGCFEKLYHY